MEEVFAGHLNARLWDHMSDFLFDEVFRFLFHFAFVVSSCSLITGTGRMNVLIYIYIFINISDGVWRLVS